LQGLEVVHKNGIAHQFISPKKIICTRHKDKLHYGLVGFEDAQFQEDCKLEPTTHAENPAENPAENKPQMGVGNSGSLTLGESSRTALLQATVRTHLAYMSPEQQSTTEVHCEYDLWAVAVTLFEAVTGSVPYPGDCARTRPREAEEGLGEAETQMLDARDLAKAKGNALSDTFVAFLEKALRRNRNERFPNAVAMEHALREVPSRERKKVITYECQSR
jgi:serine/threonine protein kinase